MVKSVYGYKYVLVCVCVCVACKDISKWDKKKPEMLFVTKWLNGANRKLYTQMRNPLSMHIGT